MRTKVTRVRVQKLPDIVVGGRIAQSKAPYPSVGESVASVLAFVEMRQSGGQLPHVRRGDPLMSHHCDAGEITRLPFDFQCGRRGRVISNKPLEICARYCCCICQPSPQPE